MLNDLLTESDGKTFCPVRAVGLGAAVLYHVGAVAGIFESSIKLDIVTLGQYLQHMSILAGTLGVGVGAKSIMKGDAQ